MIKNTKIGFVSLGCPKNQIDTEIMLGDLAAAGYTITSEEIDADIIIINTCAFIESAKREAIDNILDIAWLKKNKNLKHIIVAGCLVERYCDEVIKEFPEVDGVIGVGSIRDIVEAVETVMKNEKYVSRKPLIDLALGGDRVVTTPEYSAYLKIAEGCDNHCSYCAIPSIRGSYRSRSIEDIVSEAETLAALGAKELILVAQDTTSYGIDIYNEYKLAELIKKITENTTVEWIRLLYCYPDKITPELISEICDNPKVVKYIDIPIQHISDRILQLMNRRGGGTAVRSAITALRSAVPGIAVRTTALVGFPGETNEEFEELCQFVKESGFERFGAFAYSREEGTPAYDMDGQIDEQTKQDRLDIIMDLQLGINSKLNEAKIGHTVTVLCEGYDVVSEMYYGRSYADAPDIDGKIYFTCPKRLKNFEGKFINVKITSALDYDLIGEAVL